MTRSRHTTPGGVKMNGKSGAPCETGEKAVSACVDWINDDKKSDRLLCVSEPMKRFQAEDGQCVGKPPQKIPIMLQDCRTAAWCRQVLDDGTRANRLQHYVRKIPAATARWILVLAPVQRKKKLGCKILLRYHDRNNRWLYLGLMRTIYRIYERYRRL
jgi:hypothetical protein